jgi:outer membrane protein insertion porin family
MRFFPAYYLLAFTLVSCSPARFLTENETLHHKTEITYKEQPPASRGKISNDLLEIAEPKPNSRFLGIPVRLNIYSLFSRAKEKSPGGWIRRKIGSPPVVYDPERVGRSSLIMEKYLKDRGYFQAEVEADTTSRRRKTTVNYQIWSGPLYHIRNYHLPPDSGSFAGFVRQQQEKSAISPGKPYRLDALTTERVRIAQLANDEGFYGVRPDDLYFFLDTAIGDYQLDIYQRIAPAEDSLRHEPHYIGRTAIYAYYLLDAELEQTLVDTVHGDEFSYIGSEAFVRRSVLERSILQRQGEVYSRQSQSKTINRLLGLGVYRFVNFKYEFRRSGDSLFLDRLAYLTPDLTQDFSAEIEAKTGRLFGSELSTNYTHRNLFRGAEKLKLGFSGGVETEFGKNVNFINTLDLSGRAELELPVLLIPFKGLRPREPLQPQTTISLANQYQRRTGFFALNSFQLQFGYQWRPSTLLRHEIYPLNMTQVRLLGRSQVFQDSLDKDPLLRENFSNYFIPGAVYRFSYTDQRPGARGSYNVLHGSVESSGNAVYGVSRLFRGRLEEPYELLGLRFAQFLRTEIDARRNFAGRRASSLVARLNLGLIYSYGNSLAAPYVRQFFAGGSNGIRAFRLRGLGPGSYGDAALNTGPGIYNDQTGDIKLEFNIEYRFPLVSYLKGALFVDAGNIWLLRDPGDQRPGGTFDFDRFYNEIAVGGGFGLRLDLTYFIIRLDVAAPLRKPFLPEGRRWVWQSEEEGFARRPWWGNNLRWNLGLGYPF